MLKGGLEIIAKVRMGRNPQILAETQKILKVKPEIETLTPKQIELRNSGVDLKAKLNEKLDQNNQQIKTQQAARKEAVNSIKQVRQNESIITKDLQTIGKQSGGELVGLDKRFKSEESLTRKFADRIQSRVIEAEKKGKNVDEIRNKYLQKEVDRNNDALRYTYTFSPEKYAEGYNQTVKVLEKQGYKLEKLDNYWLLKGTKDDTGYRGMNATFIAPNGQKFELQFHTPESFKFKNDNHYLYEEVRNPKTSQKRKDEIDQQNINASKSLETPQNVENIINMRNQQ